MSDDKKTETASDKKAESAEKLFAGYKTLADVSSADEINRTGRLRTDSDFDDGADLGGTGTTYGALTGDTPSAEAVRRTAGKHPRTANEALNGIGADDRK